MLKNILIVAIVAVLVIWGAVAGYRYLRPGEGDESGGSQFNGSANAKHGDSNNPVNALGRIEPQGGLIDVGGMAGDRLGSLSPKAAEGEWVHADEELGYLASHALRLAEKHAAEAQLAEAETRQAAEEAYGAAQLAESQLALKQLDVEKLDVEAQKAKAPLLQANLELAERDLDRFEKLGTSIISEQEVAHQRLRVKQADAERESAGKQLAKMEAGLALNERLTKAKHDTAEQAVQRIKAASMLETLKANVDLAEKRLETTIVRAPKDGMILKVLTRAGENIGQKPILRMGNTKKMTVVAEVFESDIKRLKDHKILSVSCTSKALKSALTGKVARIGSIVAKNEVDTLNPTASADARVVEVLIDLDPSEEAAQFINLQVDVKIQLGEKLPAHP